MEGSEDDDEEDHLEERDKDVGGGDHQTNHTQDGRYGTLHCKRLAFYFRITFEN